MVQCRVNDTINSWKAKFIELSSRPCSLNSYAPSKVWFKWHTVDLRVSDINSITSKIKSWRCQDQLEKPEEMLLFRPITSGGLGLHNVRIKDLASLIRTFMETLVNPSFLHCIYHTILYRVYVLQDDSTPATVPHYYSISFFNSIRWVRKNTPLNVTTMSTVQWYRVMLEHVITMEENNTMEYISSRS